MKQTFIKIALSLFIICSRLQGQDSGELLQMNFPGIYFKYGTMDYAAMPYSVDSCFRYIAKNIKDINSLVMWRDSSEAEQLTVKRIRKIRSDLDRYTPSGSLFIQSMGKEQRVSQRTIHETTDSTRIQYLLTLNSVFDVSGVDLREKTSQKGHGLHPRWWCLKCWRRGAFTNRKPPKTAR